MTAVCNATGLVPQSEGLSFPPATRSSWPRFASEERCGTLEKEGVTEVTSSVYRDGRDVPHHLALGTSWCSRARPTTRGSASRNTPCCRTERKYMLALYRPST